MSYDGIDEASRRADFEDEELFEYSDETGDFLLTADELDAIEDDEDDDHQPDEYTEWQDVYGGDDQFEPFDSDLAGEY